MMEHQDTPKELDKPHSDRYTAISLKILLGHTTPDNENHCTINESTDKYGISKIMLDIVCIKEKLTKLF